MKNHILSKTAPKAIGTYSHAVECGGILYISGQVPLHPDTMQLAQGTENQIRQAFENIKSIVVESGGSLQDVIKVNIFLTDLSSFPMVNSIMAEYFKPPYPARAAIGVAALPLGSEVEIEAIAQVRNS